VVKAPREKLVEGSSNAIPVLAECYANKCFAERLSGVLEGAIGVRVEVKHKSLSGRDRVVKELSKLASSQPGYIIGVIDYEVGVSREFIYRSFSLEGVEGGVLVGQFKSKPNVLAVIFDPNIEEALLCREPRRRLCRNPEWLGRVKSSEACNAVNKILDEDDIAKLIHRVGERLREKLSSNSNPQR